jgi:hypothetical protein
VFESRWTEQEAGSVNSCRLSPSSSLVLSPYVDICALRGHKISFYASLLCGLVSGMNVSADEAILEAVLKRISRRLLAASYCFSIVLEPRS